MNITPIEKHDGIFYKRDDLFSPYGEGCVNGGKLRQAISLLHKCKDQIREKYNGVVTHTQVHSTTGTIVAKVCKDLGLKCTICIGGSSPKTISRHHMMNLASHYNATIINVCGTGMHGPVIHRMAEMAKKDNLFNAVFSKNADHHRECVIDCISDQVSNIPDELDQLVIPVGGGIQFAAICRGLQIHGKKVKRIVGLCVGPERSQKINEYINPMEFSIPEYELHCLDTQYGKPEIKKVNDFYLDELYEAKSHKWMESNLDTKNNSTLFWIVGRRPTPVEVDSLIQKETQNGTTWS